LRFTYLFLFLFIFSSNSTSFTEKEDGVGLSDKSFPWELVIDRGKILGCVYENRFYSLGSILILESLPRKCGLATDRNGVWEQLPEPELLLFKESVATEQELAEIGDTPISNSEAMLIKYLRSVKEHREKKIIKT